MTIWNLYGVRAWPTLVLIDPAGRIVATRSGEGIYEPFHEAITRIIEMSDSLGQVDRTPRLFQMETETVRPSLLSFPGKVLADEQNGRLFIADSNHNRVVVVSLVTSEVTDVVGSGTMGLADGPFEEAAFNHSQGMAVQGDHLHVADTGNHAIRLVDLAARRVSTIAGTGRQAEFGETGGEVRTARLNSPWDVVLVGKNLYIAMAGAHQIWALDIIKGRVRIHAGSGREGRSDGPLLTSALAQPSGITTDGKTLYFCDSEVSAIRTADLSPQGRVRTIVGEDLFEFGDRDGDASVARLQHPLGVTVMDGQLYIADTYDNKIKHVDPGSGMTETVFGTGEAGWRDGRPALFYEPGGISAAGGRLYIADTNNHAIRIADISSGQVSTMELRRLDKLTDSMPDLTAAAKAVQLEPRMVSPGDIRVDLDVRLPQGFHLNATAPNTIVLAADSDLILFPEGRRCAIASPQFPVSVIARGLSGEGQLAVTVSLYYCREDRPALCHYRALSYLVPLTVTQNSQARAVSIPMALDEK